MDSPLLTDLLAIPKNTEYKPEILDLNQTEQASRFNALLSSEAIQEVRDSFPDALEDLFRIEYPYIAPGSPEFKKNYALFTEQYYIGQDPLKAGIWAYFPWRKLAIHLPTEDEYFTLRTSRNKFLITAEEQATFYNRQIGLAGLSVGFSILQTIILSGGGKNVRIADFDTLSITNLNRLPATSCDLGLDKYVIAARRAYEVNPFSNLEMLPTGLQEEHLTEFFIGNRKLDLFIEETDNIRLKILSRFKARELGIPVIMATDNGDNTIVDVERFDLEPDRPLFHNRVPEEKLRTTSADLPLADKVRLANAIVGPDVTPRMQHSLTQVGSKLPAWPQLGNAATLSGATMSYVARRILTGQTMPSGRYEVNLDALIDTEYHEESAVTTRSLNKENFIEGFNLLYGEDW